MENRERQQISPEQKIETPEKEAEARFLQKLKLWRDKMGVVEAYEKAADYVEHLTKKGYSKEKLAQYKAFHHLCGSTINETLSPYFDLKGEDSFENFIDEQLSESKSGGKEQ